MEHRKYPSKLNNRGLTLIELIAVIAIIGVFGVVIASFITSTANFYRHASDTANVQTKYAEYYGKYRESDIEYESIYFLSGEWQSG